jgi:hypothetical protein
LKDLPNKIDTPILTEEASDLEIRTAWKHLCELQGDLKERQKSISQKSKFLYDKWGLTRKNILHKIDPSLELKSGDEKAVEEKSREVMKSLSAGKENLVGEQTLLTEVEGWRSK